MAIKKFWNNIRKHSITTRVLLFFTVAVIVPYFVAVVLLFNHFRTAAIDTVGMSMKDSMISVAAQINDRMKEKEMASLSIYYDGCADLLAKDSLTETEKTIVTESLQSYIYSNSHTRAAYIVDRKHNRTYRGSTAHGQVLKLMEPMFEEIERENGRCQWYWTNELGGRATECKYILARSINDRREKNIAVLLLVFDNRLAAEPFQKLVSENERYLVDAEGHILYSSTNSRTGTLPDPEVLQQSGSKGYTEVKDSRKVTYTKAEQKLAKADWYCVSLMQNDQILKNSGFFPETLLLLFLIYGALLLLIIQVLNNKIFHPLSILKRTMDTYANGQLGVMQIEPVGSGELKSLSTHFNQMTERIDGLMEAYKQETEEKNRQKYLTLSAQMTPHFIYNSLNTIRWMALLNKVENIPRFVESLIYIFRSAANVDESEYTLKDELSLVENYSVIQKERFTNFDLIIEKSEDCDNCKFKKLLLQPVVENAIVHGLGRGKIQDAEIRIRIWTDENLHIEVRDRGIGFDVEEWRKGDKKTEQHTNIGLKNIEEIIQLTYGEPYHISIESEAGKGTVVTYLLPVIRKDDLQ